MLLIAGFVQPLQLGYVPPLLHPHVPLILPPGSRASAASAGRRGVVPACTPPTELATSAPSLLWCVSASPSPPIPVDDTADLDPTLDLAPRKPSTESASAPTPVDTGSHAPPEPPAPPDPAAAADLGAADAGDVAQAAIADEPGAPAVSAIRAASRRPSPPPGNVQPPGQTQVVDGQ